MFNTLLRLYDGLNNPQPPGHRAPPVDITPPTSALPPEALVQTLRPVQNWSHPFRDKGNALSQLVQLSKAAGGYYPLGRNALWHGGVHFDSGTAGTTNHSSVHCLADGEVVAYRTDQHSPTTPYIGQGECVPKPFSRNFVLVRHHLQPPKIEGITDIPPSLTFYSLYMHLQDWAMYLGDPTIIRPAFWPEGTTRRVKETVNDVRVDPHERRGLNVRHQAHQGKTIALLPRGTEVMISGEGDYRKLENTTGPDHLKDADGSLLGYLSIYSLEPIDGGQFRVKGQHRLNLHAEANGRSRVIETLHPGTQVTVSGEGEYRKLEFINQYVHFPSLQGSKEPLAHDRVVVLDEPIAIKAGDLIGHLGLYQDAGAEHPEKKLHLEVISGEGVDAFIEASRAWAKRLPDTEKTWLKLAKGTPVVPHQETYSATQDPILTPGSPVSGTDLLVPKTLLDSLPAERKIIMEKAGSHQACHWYRLDGLLNDTDNNRLDGWVCEEVGVTPWVSPWSWEGYEVIFSHDTPREYLAAYLRDLKRLNEAQLEHYGPIADEVDNGPLKNRLYDIIDRNRDGKITANELQAAISLPAHAQAISQLIIHCESEWYDKPRKWDLLDELLGHSGSTPHLNWLAEKARIKEISWWVDVAEKVGLPGYGEVYHFHPVGLLGHFAKGNELIRVEAFLLHYEKEHKSFAPGTPNLTPQSKENLRKVIIAINAFYESSPQEANLYEVAYMLATARHETYIPRSAEFFSERSEFGPQSHFDKYDPVFAADANTREKAKRYGNLERGDGYKYRGRGSTQLTWRSNYQKLSDILAYDFVSDPDAAAKIEYSVPIMIVGMTKGIFTTKKLSLYLNAKKIDYEAARKVINGNDKKELIASYAQRFEAILKYSSELPLEF